MTVLATINDVPSPKIPPTLAISFSPHDGAFSFSGSQTWSLPNAFYALVGTQLTFTATATIVSPRVAMEYYWDFGDGATGYGSSITHTYKAKNLNCQVTLRVTDDLGNASYTRTQIYLH